MSDRVGFVRRARRTLGRVRRGVRHRVLGRKRSRRNELLAKLDSYQAPQPTPALPGVRAAVAGGERLRAGLAWEWSQVELAAGTWREALSDNTVDLVLLEMVGGAIYGWGANNDTEPRELIGWARGNDVPVLTWVTDGSEDPDSAAPWIDGVSQVFLDNASALDKWRARWPEAPVEVLPPAAQPRLHNPRIGGPARRRQPAAGVLYHGQSPAEDTLGTFDSSKLDVWAADARAEAALENSGLRSSAMYGKRLSPVSSALSRYPVFAELGSSAEPSWVAVEAGCAQIPVITEASAISRIPEDLREHVTAAENPDEFKLDVAARLWQTELRDREGVRLARAVHARHTFRRRVDEITRAAGVSVTRPGRTVSAIVPTNRPHQLDNVFTNIARQAHATDAGVELVLVLHGLDLRTTEVEARAKDAGVDNITVIEAESSCTLGACMNLGVDAAAGAFIAKMDDDNFYGRHYLTDLVAAFDYTDAGIVGKWAHYVWLRSTGAVILRTAYAEHRYERLVQGGSIVFAADVVRDLRFGDLPRAVDTDILNRAHEAGIETYAGDRFNYVSVRGADRHAHTWTIGETALMNRAGSLVFYGDPRAHVDI